MIDSLERRHERRSEIIDFESHERQNSFCFTSASGTPRIERGLVY